MCIADGHHRLYQSLLVAVIKTPWQTQLKERRIHFGSQFEGSAHHSREVRSRRLRELLKLHPHKMREWARERGSKGSRERARGECFAWLVLCSFLLLNNIPTYGHTAFELFLLWDHCERYCYECSHESFWVSTIFFIFSGLWPGMRSLDYIFTILLSKVAVPLSFLRWGFPFFFYTSLLMLIFWVFKQLYRLVRWVSE